MLTAHIKHRLGNFINALGWDLRPVHKIPQCTADLIGVGLCLLRTQQSSRPIRIIQVGAFDGVLADPLRKHLQSPDVQAVLLEPQPSPYAKLVALYSEQPNIRPMRLAIAETDGTLKMWSSNLELGEPTSSSVHGHNKRFGVSSTAVKSFDVPCVTVPTLLAQIGWDALDFLQVDVEGADWRVVRQFLNLSQPPRLINFEFLHLSPEERRESSALLQSKGYQIVDGPYDRFAFASSLLN